MPRNNCKKKPAGGGDRGTGGTPRRKGKNRRRSRTAQPAKEPRAPTSYVKYHEGDGARTASGLTVHCVGGGGLLTTALGIGPDASGTFATKMRDSIMKRYVDAGLQNMTGLAEGKIADGTFWSGGPIMFTVKDDRTLPLAPAKRVWTSFPGAMLAFGMHQEGLFHKIGERHALSAATEVKIPEGFTIDTVNWIASDEKTACGPGDTPRMNTLTVPAGTDKTGKDNQAAQHNFKSSKFPAPFRTKSSAITVGAGGTWYVNYQSGR